MKARITEQGNGFPDVGDYCTDGDSLYRVLSTESAIHTENSPRGNWITARVVAVDWSACSEAEQHSATVELEP